MLQRSPKPSSFFTSNPSKAVSNELFAHYALRYRCCFLPIPKYSSPFVAELGAKPRFPNAARNAVSRHTPSFPRTAFTACNECLYQLAHQIRPPTTNPWTFARKSPRRPRRLGRTVSTHAAPRKTLRRQVHIIPRVRPIVNRSAMNCPARIGRVHHETETDNARERILIEPRGPCKRNRRKNSPIKRRSEQSPQTSYNESCARTKSPYERPSESSPATFGYRRISKNPHAKSAGT